MPFFSQKPGKDRLPSTKRQHAVSVKLSTIAWGKGCGRTEENARQAPTFVGLNSKYQRVVTKVRVDKWLWSVRIFKSRTLAADACKAGRVRIDGEPVKPSHLIGENVVLTVRKSGFNFQFRVLKLLEKRVGAPIAVTCYEDITSAEEKNKYNAWFLNALGSAETRQKGAGRPTKKERRELERFKDSPYEGFFDDE